MLPLWFFVALSIMTLCGTSCSTTRSPWTIAIPAVRPTDHRAELATRREAWVDAANGSVVMPKADVTLMLWSLEEWRRYSLFLERLQGVVAE